MAPTYLNEMAPFRPFAAKAPCNVGDGINGGLCRMRLRSIPLILLIYLQLTAQCRGTVIASEAKQSIPPPKESMDCFRLRSLSYGGQFVGLLLAMTASDVKSHPATRCVRAVERTVRPKNQRAQGMPGARCTRGLACKFVRKNAHEHTGSAEALRHSPRNGFTAYSVLFPATNSSCHRRQRINGMTGTPSGRHASA